MNDRRSTLKAQGDQDGGNQRNEFP